MISSNKLALTLVLAAVLAVGVSGIAKAYADNNKDIKLHFDITVKGQKGEKGAKGDTGSKGDKGDKGDSIVGPAGPKGDSGNVTVNVCQQGTGNCISKNVEAGDTLNIIVNATGNVVNDNGTVPNPEPVVCQPGFHEEAGACVADAVIPPVNETGGNTTTTVTNTTTTDNGTSTTTNTTETNSTG